MDFLTLAGEAASTVTATPGGIAGAAGTLLAAVAALVWQTVEARRARKVVVETHRTAREIERKVTSNHGHDSIGDKVDELVDRVTSMEGLQARTIESVGEVRTALGEHIAACDQERRERERARLEELLERPIGADDPAARG
jgi:uncharacterized membrane protein YccC